MQCLFIKDLLKAVILIYLAFFLSSNFTIGTKIYSINYDNTPPNPPYIEGPAECHLRERCYYDITVTNPDKDRLLELFILFGNGKNFSLHAKETSYRKTWRSGTRLTIGHNWKKPRNFTIKAKVKNIYWDWRDWGTFDVHVQKSNLNFKNSIKLDLDIKKIPYTSLTKLRVTKKCFF